MAMAEPFQHISIAATRVLARQAAIALVKSELQRRGERVHSVPMRDIHIAADDYLATHHCCAVSSEHAYPLSADDRGGYEFQPLVSPIPVRVRHDSDWEVYCRD